MPANSAMHSPARRQARARAQLTRRLFLTGVGATAAAAAGIGAVGLADAQTTPTPANRFGRMFPSLPPYVPADERCRQAMISIGAVGGIMDADDDLAAGPIQLILDPALSANNPDNPTHTAGTTFFGQFLDHDMTFDQTSPLGTPTRPEISPNDRTPALDLDTVYGGGPAVDPELYETDGRHLRIESGGLFEDVPRVNGRTAIIGDPRNDENAILSGLHAAFILFHNEVVDRLVGTGYGGNVFTEARRLVTWHYQWIIVHTFLPQVCGQAVVDDILDNGRDYYKPEPNPAFMPIEFQIAYRMGHSMIRPSYRLNLQGDNGGPFFGFIFDPAAQFEDDPSDMRGGVRKPRRFVGWQTFFDFGDGQVRRNKQLDPVISTPLFRLPLGTIPGGQPPISLAQRNLLRHMTWSVPAGQRIAQTMGHQMLMLQDAMAPYGIALENQTPLWFYVLAEAEQLGGGLRLGPTGARLIAEVFLGLIELDPTSYLAVAPTWRPTLPSTTPGGFLMQDLLRFAGVDPATRGQ
jgi:hypothetical protein